MVETRSQIAAQTTNNFTGNIVAMARYFYEKSSEIYISIYIYFELQLIFFNCIFM